MKKILLTLTAAIGLVATANAQATRLSLVEEYTGENCGPCAANNPAFWALLNSGSNPSEALHITYMEPIPSSGWFYLQDKATSDTRISYYQNWFNITTGVTGEEFTPAVVQDGHIPDGHLGTSGAMNIFYFVQADIDSMHGVPSPFTMSVVSSWDATFSNITSVITVTNAMASTYAPAGATFMLRVALVETVDFATPPGNNGESHFQHVVRAMYPSAAGTSISGSWAAGATQTFTVTGACPSYVDKSKSPFVAVWVQNDNDLSVEQSAMSNTLPAPANDAALWTATGPTGLICATGTYSVTHSTVLVNNGTNTLTSATIYYSADGGALSSYAWSGSLAATSSTSVSMPAIPVTIGADVYHTIYDSVGMPNGSASVNPAVAVAGGSFFVENSAGQALPYGTSFEANDTNYFATDLSSDGNGWGVYYSGSSTSLAHTGTYAAGDLLGYNSAGEQNILIMPEVHITTPATTNLTFYEAYSELSAGSTTKLEVVYSTDCGSTWTSVWNMSGSSMATLPASTSTIELPTSPSQYALRTASLSAIPAGVVMLGFRYTMGNGNTIWIDDAKVSSTTGVTNVTANIETKLYPNPTKDEATLSFNLNNASDVTIQIVDGLGRVVSVVANDKMDAGAHSLTINTATLPSGVYNVTMHTDEGTSNERLTVIK